MVMVTRSSYRKARESLECSDQSNQQKNFAAPPAPWCSLAKIHERKKNKKVAPPPWETRSSYPLRKNIWEYLYEDKRKFYKRKNGRSCCKQTPAKNKRRGKIVIYLGLLFFVVGLISSFWPYNKLHETSIVAIPRASVLSLVGLEHTSVDEECCSRMKHLTEALIRAEQALRNTLRLRRTMLLASHVPTAGAQNTDKGYIFGITVKKGSKTTVFGGRVALWGVVPLWRAAPPPDTVLALRKPTPADCWPFSGSYGELVFKLPRKLRIGALSVEHIRPDSAMSAPKHFVLYGILANGTWITGIEGQYRHNGPAKQYYLFRYKHIFLEKLVLRVLSNQGNAKYTCMYRLHLYESHDPFEDLSTA